MKKNLTDELRLFASYVDEFAKATYAMRKTANELSHEDRAHFFEEAAADFERASARLVGDLFGAMQDLPTNEMAQAAFKRGLQAALRRENAEDLEQECQKGTEY